MDVLGNAPNGARVRLDSGRVVLVVGEERGMVLVEGEGGARVALPRSTTCSAVPAEGDPLAALVDADRATIRATLPELRDADLLRYVGGGVPMWVAHEVEAILAARRAGGAPVRPDDGETLAVCPVCSGRFPVVPAAKGGRVLQAHQGQAEGWCPGSGKAMEAEPVKPAPARRRAKKPAELPAEEPVAEPAPQEVAEPAEVPADPVVLPFLRSVERPPAEPAAPAEPAPAERPDPFSPLGANLRATCLAALGAALAAADGAGLGLTITLTLPPRSRS